MIRAINALKTKLEQSPLARRFIGGASWSLLATGLSQAIIILTMMMIARTLGKEIYGQFVLIQSTLSMIGVFAGAGLGATVLRYASALKKTDKRKLERILTLSERAVLIFGVLTSVCLMLSSNFITTKFLKTPELSYSLAIASSFVLFSTLDNYWKSVLVGFEAMKTFAISSIVGAALNVPILLFGVFNFGINGAATGLIIGSLIQALISRHAVRKVEIAAGIKHRTKDCLKEVGILRDFALPALLASVLIPIGHWICQALLATSVHGYSEVALLGIAMQWFNVLMFLPTVAGKVVVPMLTQSVTGDNKDETGRILKLAIISNALVSIPIAAMVCISSSSILKLYGREFVGDEGTTLILIVIAATLISIMAPVGNLLAACSKMWLGLAMNLCWAFSYVILGWIFVDKGALGISIALLSAYIVLTMVIAIWWLFYSNSGRLTAGLKI